MCLLEVHLLGRGKMDKCKDLREFDKGEIVMLDNCRWSMQSKWNNDADVLVGWRLQNLD